MVIEDSVLWFIISLAGGGMGLLFAVVLTRNVLSFNEGSDAMKKISGAIRQGASAYLNRQYKTVAVITGVIALLILGTAPLLGIQGVRDPISNFHPRGGSVSARGISGHDGLGKGQRPGPPKPRKPALEGPLRSRFRAAR